MTTPRWTIGVWIALLTLFLTGSEATITIVETGERISSRPARSVGERFRVGFEYMARLQYFPDNLELCPDDHPFPYNHNYTVTVPSDGLPVALLARKGDCSYLTKARFAAYTVKPPHVVKYLIVFDDKDHHHHHVRDFPIDEDFDASLRREESAPEGLQGREVNIKVLLVSHKNGMELLHTTLAPEVDSVGGPRILLDGRSFTPLTKNAIFWMGLSLLLSACLCSFLLSMQVNRLNDDLESAEGNTRPTRRRLTVEEVETLLPETVYDGSNVDNSLTSLVARASHEEEKDAAEDGLTATPDNEQISSPFFLLPHQDDCSICLDDYMQGDRIRSLPCGHGFHSACITKWLTERSSTCPLCKAMLERVDDSDDDSSLSSTDHLVEVQEESTEEEVSDSALAVRAVYQALAESLTRARRRNTRWWRRWRSRTQSQQEDNNATLEVVPPSEQPLLEEDDSQAEIEAVEST